MNPLEEERPSLRSLLLTRALNLVVHVSADVVISECWMDFAVNPAYAFLECYGEINLAWTGKKNFIENRA